MTEDNIVTHSEVPFWGSNSICSRLSPIQRQFLNYIRKLETASISDLVASSSYSRAHTSRYVKDLLEKKLIVEDEIKGITGKRKSIQYRINKDLGIFVGVDVGVTSIDYLLTDSRGNRLFRKSIWNDVAAGPVEVLNKILQDITSALEQILSDARHVAGIGIGFPGPVNFAEGKVISPPIMPGWDNYPIKQFIQSKFPNASVVIDNDVNIMALGEHLCGICRDKSNIIYVKVGTGIGAGIICDGRLFRGSSGCAGDIGHICVDPDGPICACGNRGCLEALAGGKGIAKRATEDAVSGKSKFLSQLIQEHNKLITAEDVGEAARNGDSYSIELIQETGTLIGLVLASLVNFFNPETIVIGGGVSKFGDIFLSTIRQNILLRSLPLATKNLQVVYAGLPGDSGVIGAVNLAMNCYFECDCP